MKKLTAMHLSLFDDAKVRMIFCLCKLIQRTWEIIQRKAVIVEILRCPVLLSYLSIGVQRYCFFLNE
jgi:hypothetical protein